MIDVIMQLNHLAVFVAALSSLVVGFAWYSQAMFGKQWMKLSGITQKDMAAGKNNMGKTMLMALINSWIMAYVLGAIMSTSASGPKDAVILAFWLWLGFQATLLFGAVLWERKPLGVYFINVANQLVTIVVMALILASWL